MIEANSRAYWRATIALCIGSFMIFANVYLTQPLLPTLSMQFGLSALEAGLTFTSTTLTLGISLLFYGVLSDVLGRRGIMTITLVSVVICGLILSFGVETYHELIALRAFQGLMLGGLPAIAIAYMNDEFTPRALGLAVGLYIGGNTLGGIGGRLIGGFVGEWLGWQGAFLVMTAVSFICVLAFIWLLPKSENFHPSPFKLGAMLGGLNRHLNDPLLLGAYLIGGLNFFIFINQYSYITFVLAAPPYNLPASLLGMLFLTYLAGTLGSAMSGKIADYMPRTRAMMLGISLHILGTLVTGFDTLITIIIGLMINSFGFFFCHSTLSSWVSRNAKLAKASASALYLVFYYLGASLGGFYLQPFWSLWGWSGVVIASLAVLLFTLSLSWRLELRNKCISALSH